MSDPVIYIGPTPIHEDTVAGGFWLPDGRRVEFVIKPAKESSQTEKGNKE